MDTVINRLSEIEAAAGAIVEEANARKKAFAEEMDAKTAAFAYRTGRIDDVRSQRKGDGPQDCRDSGEDGGGHERAPCKAEGRIRGPA